MFTIDLYFKDSGKMTVSDVIQIDLTETEHIKAERSNGGMLDVNLHTVKSVHVE